MKTITIITLILIGITCYSQEKKEVKKDTSSFSIESQTLQKLKQIEENWKNFNDPKWIQEQRSIISMQYELIINTILETKKIDPSKVKNHIANGRIYIEKL